MDKKITKAELLEKMRAGEALTHDSRFQFSSWKCGGNYVHEASAKAVLKANVHEVENEYPKTIADESVQVWSGDFDKFCQLWRDLLKAAGGCDDASRISQTTAAPAAPPSSHEASEGEAK